MMGQPTSQQENTNKRQQQESDGISSGDYYTDSNAEVENKPTTFLSPLAIFGDSSSAVLASFLLLIVAVLIALYLDETNIEGPLAYDQAPRRQSSCAIDTEQDIFQNVGDLNRMFRRILDFQDDVFILSEPSQGPWVLQIENFISKDEAQRLIRLGQERGFKPSGDVVPTTTDSTTTYTVNYNAKRTSTNAWCDQQECLGDSVTLQVSRRIHELTQIPTDNCERLQLLQYQTNQFYGPHSDYIPYQTKLPSGVRILTIFLYLNNVDAGGETNFPHLNLTITPQVGRAVLWPNVWDHRPNQKDPRTNHQALPVLHGVKYAANIWLHQRDYQTPKAAGCQ